MKTTLLKAEVREVQGKKIKKLRQGQKLPAVIYGHGAKNINLTVDYRTFEDVYKEAGSSSLVDLEIGGGKPIKVLIHEVQSEPLSGRYQHVDFYQVKMTEKISTDVELKFTGESKAVKELGGILVKSLDEVNIECLPEALVHEIEVDISPLNTFEDMIRVKDIKLPPGIVLKEKEETVVVSVQPPRSEEELKSLEEKPEEKVEEVAKAGEEKEAEAPAEEGTAEKTEKPSEPK